MFQERKQGMMDTKVGYTPGDDNSKFYTKPDEAPISHPAEVLEKLKKEKPDAQMEDLVKEADAIVSAEIEARQKQREKEDQLESVKEDDESPA
jgi:hypothetical protein